MLSGTALIRGEGNMTVYVLSFQINDEKNRRYVTRLFGYINTIITDEGRVGNDVQIEI